MERHHISHRELLERVLPLDQLPPDVRDLVDAALRSPDADRHERASRRAVRSLVASGVLREVDGRGDGPFTFLNRVTGGRLVVDWSRLTPAWTVRQPIPPSDEQQRIPIAAVESILRLDEALDPTRSETDAFVRHALDVLTALIPADFVSYLPMGPEATKTTDVLRRWIPDDRREVVYLADVSDAPEGPPPPPARGFRSVAVAPVDAAGERRGYIELWGRSTAFLSTEQLAVLGLFAHQMGETLRRVGAIEKVAYYDEPTGLFNRQFFDTQLEKEIARARRAGEAFALAIVDIDDFKSINTRFGYIGGNDLLEQLAHLLSRSVRPFDVAARWGGEEFALILTPPVGEQEATTITNRIRAAVEATPYSVTGLDGNRHAVRLTVSVGVSVFPDLAETGREMWTTANAALQVAKTTGKNRVVVFRPGMAG